MFVNLLQKNFDIAFKEYYTESEMISDLRFCKKGYSILNNSEYDFRFVSVKFSLSNEQDYYGIGFWCSNYIFTPNVLLYSNVLIISFDNCIALFDIENHTEITTHTFSYPIEHLELYNNTVIAISELDFIQMNLNGDILSEHPFDTSMESYEFVEDKLICHTEKGKLEYKIS
ncbi:MAG: hypothetical protein IKL57_04370 [Oscillospiraceae bacterium]|nr:hypothetical protein [Oscillospiraceae bacterium]